MLYVDDSPHTRDRRTLAREVHDRIGSGLCLALRQLELLEADSAPMGERPARRLDAARTALQSTLTATRALASGLRGPGPAPMVDSAAGPAPAIGPAPAVGPALSGSSLESALRSFVRSMRIPGPLDAHVRVQVLGDTTRLPPATVDELFVIVRESLRNALAHAHARRVTAVLRLTPYAAHASVADDGRGFDLAATLAGGRTNGLLAMAERAQALGGSAEVATAPGEGTTVSVRIPVPAPARTTARTAVRERSDRHDHA
ncbi:sensor histidine kinase [Streptomyces sp. NPDC057654]|uniref:sensor histidine kinase n=1 Tax=Streptomyces sp. NPDC057654 TaxID=3346196 RepID=UPI00369BF988